MPELKPLAGQLLMLLGLIVPLGGLYLAINPSAKASDYDILTMELGALAFGFVAFQAGRSLSADKTDGPGDRL